MLRFVQHGVKKVPDELSVQQIDDIVAEILARNPNMRL